MHNALQVEIAGEGGVDIPQDAKCPAFLPECLFGFHTVGHIEAFTENPSDDPAVVEYRLVDEIEIAGSFTIALPIKEYRLPCADEPLARCVNTVEPIEIPLLL
ncbi:hypothetical protein D3C81_1984310 [compost metagenome]